MSNSKLRRAGAGVAGLPGRTAVLVGLAVASLFVVPGSARAETLREALTHAYKSNPALDAQRAFLRSRDEELPRARAGYLPTLNGTADTRAIDQNTNPSQNTDGRIHPRGYGLSLSQPLFRGFRVFNSVNVAEATVRSEREVLRGVEQTTLLDAATAYMDVVRDQAILRVRENNLRVLNNELMATQERFNVGEVTRTDVAQAQARRAGAVSALDLARSNLRTSLGIYERIVGHPAGRIQDQQPIDRLLPKSLPAATQIALAEHPNIVKAIYDEQAARHQIDVIRGERLPTVSLDAEYGKRFGNSQAIDSQETTSVTGRLNWQFWNGGEVEARIRQAKHTAVNRLQLIEQSRAVVQSGVVSAWSTLTAARAQLLSDQQQLQATQTALAGVREEEKVGQRTLLDVLNAQQEALAAEVGLITTRRNLVVASYAVLASIGRLDAANLGLGSKIYDETAHYKEVQHKLFDTRVEYIDGKKDAGGSWAGSVKDAEDRPYKLGMSPSQKTAAKKPVVTGSTNVESAGDSWQAKTAIDPSEVKRRATKP